MTEEAGAIEGAEAPQEGAAEVTPEVAAVDDIRYDYVNDKYRTDGRTEQEALEIQAKSYNDVNSMLGGFTGAPDEYEVALSEELADAGVMYDADDPLLQNVLEYAKKTNMNQDSFSELLGIWGTAQLAEKQAMQDHLAEEMKGLGVNAEKRIDGINSWANANMDAEGVAGLQEVITSAAGVQAIEQLIAKTRNAPVAAENVQPAAGITAAEVQAMQFATNENGQRLINVDPAAKAKFQKAHDLLHGTEPHRQMIG